MAGIPLNTFRTALKIVQPESGFVMGYPVPGDANYLVYTAPPGTSGVILYAQAANVGGTTEKISLWHYRPSGLPSTFTELLVGAQIPINDAMVLLGGKLVLETGDAVYVAGPPGLTPNSLKLTMSILESANQ